MKKNKLLTSLMALVLVLSVGACSNSLDDPYKAIATNPSELVDKANTYGNYSVELMYYVCESTTTMTMDEYNSIYSGDSEAYAKLIEMMYNTSPTGMIIMDIYYDTDYLYLEEYDYDLVNDTSYAYLDVMVNTEQGLWSYSYYDYYGWYYGDPDYYRNYGIITWEDEYCSLFDAAQSGVAENLQYYPSYGSYDFTDWAYSYSSGGTLSANSAEWFVDLGAEFLLYSDAYDYGYYYYPHQDTWFNEDSQELTSFFYAEGLYTDSTQTIIEWAEEYFYFTVYDVGTTDVRETVDYYHEYFQENL